MSGEVVCIVLIGVDDEGITKGVDLEGVFKMGAACRRRGTSRGAGLCRSRFTRGKRRGSDIGVYIDLRLPIRSFVAHEEL